MLTSENGRNAPGGEAIPGKGRVLVPILEEKRRAVALAAFDMVGDLVKVSTPTKQLDFAPTPKTQADGKPFKVRSERKYFFSGERTYPKD